LVKEIWKKSVMKVVIAGSRYKDSERKTPFDDYLSVVNAVKNSKFDVTEVISGRAIGVDKLGEKWANVNNCPIIYEYIRELDSIPVS